MMHDPYIIFVAKQSSIDGLLDYGVAIWIMTFSAIPSFLSNGMRSVFFGPTIGALPNRIDEIHIFYQCLSKFNIGTYAVRCLTCVEVI